MDHTLLRLVVCIDCGWKFFILGKSNMSYKHCGICGGKVKNLVGGKENNDSET